MKMLLIHPNAGTTSSGGIRTSQSLSEAEAIRMCCTETLLKEYDCHVFLPSRLLDPADYAVLVKPDAADEI